MTSREVFGGSRGKTSEGKEPQERYRAKHPGTRGEGGRRREVEKTCGRNEAGQANPPDCGSLRAHALKGKESSGERSTRGPPFGERRAGTFQRRVPERPLSAVKLVRSPLPFGAGRRAGPHRRPQEALLGTLVLGENGEARLRPALPRDVGPRGSVARLRPRKLPRTAPDPGMTRAPPGRDQWTQVQVILWSRAEALRGAPRAVTGRGAREMREHPEPDQPVGGAVNQ